MPRYTAQQLLALTLTKPMRSHANNKLCLFRFI